MQPRIMELRITDEEVTITPKTTYLSVPEIVAYRNTFTEEEQNELKSKRNVAAGTEQETIELEALYAELRKAIAQPRIERLSGRSLAVWDFDKLKARLVRKDGKFSTFGTTEGNYSYLEYYEALYLLELGRLQLEYDSLTVSIEQAYLLLLGEKASTKYDVYLVYSYLTRGGYILNRHQNILYNNNAQLNETDCIWAWLQHANEKKPIPNHIKKTQLYATTKVQIETLKANIFEQRQMDITNDKDSIVAIPTTCPAIEMVEPSGSNKRKHSISDDNVCQEKRSRFEKISYLDFLKNESEYKEFSQLFEKFDVIKIDSIDNANDFNLDSDTSGNDEETSLVSDLDIEFDMYLHNNGFKKKAPEMPLMRVVVLPANETFPCHADLTKCSRRLLHLTPILIVSVGDAKQIQAFLYFFT